MNVEEVIEKIKTAMANCDPSTPRKIEGVIQLNIAADDDSLKKWIWDITNLTIEEGENDAADATFDMSEETFLQLSNQTINIVDAEAEGKVIVSGDKQLLTALNSYKVCKN